MSQMIQTIPLVAAYFGHQEPPVVAQEFHPSRGWVSQAYRKRISGAWARKLQRAGVTNIALRDKTGRLADFTLAEVIRSARKPALTDEG